MAKTDRPWSELSAEYEIKQAAFKDLVTSHFATTLEGKIETNKLFVWLQFNGLKYFRLTGVKL